MTACRHQLRPEANRCAKCGARPAMPQLVRGAGGSLVRVGWWPLAWATLEACKGAEVRRQAKGARP